MTRTPAEIAAAVAAGEKAVENHRMTHARAVELELLARAGKSYDRPMNLNRNERGEVLCPVCGIFFPDLETDRPGLPVVDRVVEMLTHQQHWLAFHVWMTEQRWMAQVDDWLTDAEQKRRKGKGDSTG